LPHLWPTGSSSGWPPSITARYFSSCPSDSISRWTPCPPKDCSSGRRRRYRRLWIWRPSFERQRDFNPPEQRAAQRTLLAPPPPSRRPPTSRLHRLYGFPAPRISPRDEEGFSSCLRRPCHRAVANAPPEHLAASVSLRRSILPSPPNRGFGLWISDSRGHLCVHFHYGPMTCSPSHGWLCRSTPCASFPPHMRS
jgi:hypothetical protein